MAKKNNVRLKSTASLATAYEWLKLFPFDLLLLDAAVSIDEQQTLAGYLWRQNPLAFMVAYDLEVQGRHDLRQARLFGAEVAAGPSAIEMIERIIARLKPRGLVRCENFRILVVEDLDSPRDIICMYLEGLGFPEIKGVASAREALAELHGEPCPYSCILSDIKMPEMNGKELIEIVRAEERLKHLPVIVLTAYGTPDMLVDCLRAGASGFLVKPPKKDGLVMELSRAMRIVAEQRDARLVAPEDVEQLKATLIEKGVIAEG